MFAAHALIGKEQVDKKFLAKKYTRPISRCPCGWDCLTIFSGKSRGREGLDQIVGKISPALNRATMLESPADNFLLRSMQSTTGAELAFSNGGKIGAPLPEVGVTLNDPYNRTSVDPEISLVQLTGEELGQMLEENLERTFARDPLRQMGGYVKRCLGLKIYFKVENPVSIRIQDIFVNGTRLDKKKTYTSAFITVQGVPRRYGAKRSNISLCAVDAMQKYSKPESLLEGEQTFALIQASAAFREAQAFRDRIRDSI